MKFKKIHIVLLLVGALVLGFVGAYIGALLAAPDQAEQNIADHSTAQNNSNEEVTTDQNAEIPAEWSQVAQAYYLIKDNYLEGADKQQLMAGAIEGMLGTLGDPFSTYMDPETMKQFNEQIESSFEGIGAEVSQVNGVVTIVSPIKNSPAEKVGLRPNDQVLKVDGKSLEGFDLNEAVAIIRGKKGTEVVLSILRPGTTEPFDVTIVRDTIPVETVYSEMKTVDGKKTGIIEITSFSENTAQDFNKQLKDLEDDGMQGLVIDVRGNPGGLLGTVEHILMNFITDDMPYVQIEEPNGNKTPYYSTLKEKKPYPISVLINEGSASASEILAVAMKEAGYDVVGTTSFGKGTVQKTIPLGEKGDGGTIKLTFYKWLSPEGNWIHKKGVEPTIKVDEPEYYYTTPVQIEKPFAYDQADSKIKNIQIMLNGIGYKTDRTDGYFSKATEEAVKAFQKDNGLQVTGEVDEKTGGLIEAKVIEKIRSGEDDLQKENAIEALYK